MSAPTALGRDGLREQIERDALELLVFVVDDRRVGVELDAVDRVVAMVAITPLPEAPDVVLGAIDVAGAVVPVFDIGRRLGHAPRSYGVETTLVLARTSRRAVAVACDGVLGVQSVPAAAVTPADELHPATTHAAGVAALADGLLLIHDLDAFLSPDEERRLGPALTEAGAARS